MQIRLDHCQFESAHLKYAMLKLQKHYPILSTIEIAVTGESKEMNFTH